MLNLSVIILTKNEEKNIFDCLESVKDADEIIVIDDNSEDRTEDVISTFGKKVKTYKRSLLDDFSKQRNFGLSKAKNSWVLFIDADERVSDGLFAEISDEINKDNLDGYLIKRRDVLWDKKLQYGETGNIKLLRLARKNKGEWQGKVHEAWNVNGKVGELDNELIHYPHQTIREFLSEINLYSTIRANELHEKGVRISALHIVFYPKLKFLSNYFIKLGFMDGLQGLVVALMMSLHSFLVRGKLWLLQNER